MNKIQKAAETTDQVQSLVETALETLRAGFSGRTVNGYGIYHDVSMRQADLHAARDALNAAIAAMNNTSWPTNADYDEEDRARP